MKLLAALLLSFCLAAPAFAEPIEVSRDTTTGERRMIDSVTGEAWTEPGPTPIPTASPGPTPTLEPRCEDAGPLVPCRARQDPAAVLNQRVSGLEQQLQQLAQQIGQVIRQQNERIDALTPKPAAKK